MRDGHYRDVDFAIRWSASHRVVRFRKCISGTITAKVASIVDELEPDLGV
jgi:hypothetical protein